MAIRESKVYKFCCYLDIWYCYGWMVINIFMVVAMLTRGKDPGFLLGLLIGANTMVLIIHCVAYKVRNVQPEAYRVDVNNYHSIETV